MSDTRTAGRRINWNEVSVTIAAFVLAFLVGAILMIVSDSDITSKFAYFTARPSDALTASWDKVSHAYSALFKGALGGPTAITETTAQAAPLIFAGLGVGLGFRAGLFNIGAQGQAVWGSIVAAYVGFTFHGPMIVHLPLAILAGVAAGALWGGIAGILKARAGAHEVIVTQLACWAGCSPPPPSSVPVAPTRSRRSSTGMPPCRACPAPASTSVSSSHCWQPLRRGGSSSARRWVSRSAPSARTRTPRRPRA